MLNPPELAAIDRLKTLLRELTAAASADVSAAICDGTLTRRSVQYLVMHARYGEGSLGWTSETVTREEWDAGDLQTILGVRKEVLAGDFELAASLLAEIAKIDLPGARGKLQQLLLAAARQTAAETQLEDLVDRFISECSGGDLEWSMQFWLRGISLDTERLIINDEITLRLPAASDFEYETLAIAAPFHFQSPFWLGLNVPTAILEIKCRAPHQPSHKALKLVNALNLFRQGGISVIQERATPSSLLTYPTVSAPFSRPQPQPAYTVSAAELADLKEFLGRVAPVLPVKPTGFHSDRRWLALKNYFRALHEATDIEERIGQAVAALEALLLTGLRDELRYRLSMRGAALLRIAGLPPVEVARTLRKAYDFRSTYAHGDQVAQKHLQTAQEMCPKVLEYARLAILKLEVEFYNEKDRLLQDLDDSLLDDNVRHDLQRKLEGGLWNIAGLPRVNPL